MKDTSQSMKTADRSVARSSLNDAELDLVAGGRMKLPGPKPVNPPSSGSGAGMPFGEWSTIPHYLGPF
jgi:hypothetical protein